MRITAADVAATRRVPKLRGRGPRASARVGLDPRSAGAARAWCAATDCPAWCAQTPRGTGTRPRARTGAATAPDPGPRARWPCRARARGACHTHGYSDQVVGGETEFVRRTGGRVLQKPCSWRDLIQNVRQSLDEN